VRDARRHDGVTQIVALRRLQDTDRHGSKFEMTIYHERLAGRSTLATNLRAAIERALREQPTRRARPDPMATERELGMLSDHLLRDIGMERVGHRRSGQTGGAEPHRGGARILVLTGAGSRSARG
jgi:hypothetical protein